MENRQALDAPALYSLPPRESMLLCTLLTQGDSQELALLDLLPASDSARLKEVAKETLDIPHERRVPVVLREMRRQVRLSASVSLEATEPSWIAAKMRGEQPIVVGLLLAHMSKSLAASVGARLPAPVRQRIPKKTALKSISPEISRGIRQTFESGFAVAHVPLFREGGRSFYFLNVGALPLGEFLLVVRSIGLEELGAAFLTMGKRKLAELCQRLDEVAAHELLTAVRGTKLEDAMTVQGASALLRRILTGVRIDEARDPKKKLQFKEELFERAGFYRLAKAMTMEKPSFVRYMTQRLPQDRGRLLGKYVAECSRAALDGEPHPDRLQDLIMVRIRKMAKQKKIDARYAEFRFRYRSLKAEETDMDNEDS